MTVRGTLAVAGAVAVFLGGFAAGFLTHRQRWHRPVMRLLGRGAPYAPYDERWHPALWRLPRRSPPPEAVDERLAAVPYLQGYRPAGTKRQVTVHDAARAYPGFNLYTSGHAPEAYLIDMDGRVVHRWRHPLPEAWRPVNDDHELSSRGKAFRKARLLPDGSLLAIFDHIGLIKIDRDSRLVWSFGGRAHHESPPVAPSARHGGGGRPQRGEGPVDAGRPVAEAT
ncbi:MAG TPA: hypothetical protein VMR21_04000 [Vicinamibacteria bacterium]|nr:hypothetical protein [Vicinamibacteria bacterium]